LEFISLTICYYIEVTNSKVYILAIPMITMDKNNNQRRKPETSNLVGGFYAMCASHELDAYEAGSHRPSDPLGCLGKARGDMQEAQKRGYDISQLRERLLVLRRELLGITPEIFQKLMDGARARQQKYAGSSTYAGSADSSPPGPIDW
jgi:hypothetical protein